MLRRFTLGVIFLTISNWLMAQEEVQWASEVIEFSSELTPVQYSAQQALNKPNVLPRGGESPNAWTPSRPDRQDFIKVGFENPQRIQQIAIAESYNPSAVFQVYTYDGEGKEYLVNTFNPRPAEFTGRILNVFFDRTAYEVHAVKVVLNGKAVPGYNSIDAIGIADTRTPIEVEIKVAEELSEDLVIERLSDEVNSPYKELRPLISPDGNTLFFSRRNHPDNVGGEDDPEDIWFSEKDQETGEWLEAKNIGGVLNNKGPNFISSVTPDGNTIVLILGNQYKGGDRMRAGVSYSTKDGDTWNDPQPIEIENDYNYSEKANFYMANSRKVLLMSVEREDTYGDRDLYVSFVKNDGKWTEPKNLGPVINTANEELAPFLAADEKTLYFSSNGFSGYGGTDIYVSRRLDDTWQNWTEPENMGPDINSELDDEYFNIPASGSHAYYSRGVAEDDLDIFRIKLPVFYKPAPVVLVKGRVYDSKTRKPVNARIFYERLPDGMEMGIARSEGDSGVYQLTLPSGDKYGYLAEAEGYLSVNANIDLSDLSEYKEIEQDLYLVPIEVGSTITLNNIFFDFDKTELREDSYPELNRVVKFLEENDNIDIEIGGHTDSIGEVSYNQNLSERRAESVADYIRKQGIRRERLKVEGYGESKPVATNMYNDGRKQNRRVEFIILKD